MHHICHSVCHFGRFVHRWDFIRTYDQFLVRMIFASRQNGSRKTRCFEKFHPVVVAAYSTMTRMRMNVNEVRINMYKQSMIHVRAMRKSVDTHTLTHTQRNSLVHSTAILHKLTDIDHFLRGKIYSNKTNDVIYFMLFTSRNGNNNNKNSSSGSEHNITTSTRSTKMCFFLYFILLYSFFFFNFCNNEFIIKL